MFLIKEDGLHHLLRRKEDMQTNLYTKYVIVFSVFDFWEYKLKCTIFVVAQNSLSGNGSFPP